jgi:hypothetical protein
MSRTFWQRANRLFNTALNMSSKYNPSTSIAKTKRSLTPFNLFYRYKRSKILEACAAGNGDKESIHKLIKTVPGLENKTDQELRLIHPKDAAAFCRGIILNEMQDKLLPSDRKRSHRKTQGLEMEFLEMGKAMSDQWKLVDSFSRSIFKELTEEGKKLHRERFSKKKEMAEVPRSEYVDEEDPVYKMLKSDMVTKSSYDYPDLYIETITSQPMIKNHEDPVQPFAFQLHSKPAHIVSPSNSPRSMQYKKVNTALHPALPINGPSTHKSSFEAYRVSEATVEPRDEFCAYIDSHIHLVENVTLDDLVENEGML